MGVLEEQMSGQTVLRGVGAGHTTPTGSALVKAVERESYAAHTTSNNLHGVPHVKG